MAVRSGNRYVPPLHASPVTSQPRRWMAVGAANVLELEGTLGLERSFTLSLDVAARITQLAALGADTQTNIRSLQTVTADLSIRVRRPCQLEAETAIRSVSPVAVEFDEAVRVTGLVMLASDVRQAIGRPVSRNVEAAQRIYAVLRREDHLILT